MVFYSKYIISRILYKVNPLVQNLADYEKKISQFIQHGPNSYSIFEYHVTIGASCRHAEKVLFFPVFFLSRLPQADPDKQRTLRQRLCIFLLIYAEIRDNPRTNPCAKAKNVLYLQHRRPCAAMLVAMRIWWNGIHN